MLKHTKRHFKREGIAVRWMLAHGSQLEGLFISEHFPNYILGQKLKKN